VCRPGIARESALWPAQPTRPSGPASRTHNRLPEWSGSYSATSFSRYTSEGKRQRGGQFELGFDLLAVQFLNDRKGRRDGEGEVGIEPAAQAGRHVDRPPAAVGVDFTCVFVLSEPDRVGL